MTTPDDGPHLLFVSTAAARVRERDDRRPYLGMDDRG
jgi:hypothetical protein